MMETELRTCFVFILGSLLSPLPPPLLRPKQPAARTAAQDIYRSQKRHRWQSEDNNTSIDRWRLGPDLISAMAFTQRVVTWNVLSSALSSPSTFVKSDPKYLNPEYRLKLVGVPITAGPVSVQRR